MPRKNLLPQALAQVAVAFGGPATSPGQPLTNRSLRDRYVKLLCDLAPVVIVSAAQPGQAGTDHINLQQKTYWQNKFMARGRSCDWRATEDLAHEWEQAGVAGFYHENLMVFVPPAKDSKS